MKGLFLRIFGQGKLFALAVDVGIGMRGASHFRGGVVF